jgi:hypothetical protein
MDNIDQIDNFDFDFNFDEIENSFDLDLSFFSDESDTNIETRIIKPPKQRSKPFAFKNAIKTADKIKIEPGMNYFSIIDGSFIFGDLIEALFVSKPLRAHRMDVSTLSMSQENVDSLGTLLIKGYVNYLNLIVSDYFFSHERKSLIPYIYQELDIDNRFQLAVAGSHCKIMAAKLTNGIHLVIHGSANLRSSGNIEQIMIQDSEEIYNFVIQTNDKIIEKYKTIDKSVRRAKLWQVVAK